ncbi:hypothetical protein BC835DRAFT_311047 [Cytidiella melzeri]|nr:hypothetical protein BC835DRAFT_311047 [Cytidiella melzeri]
MALETALRLHLDITALVVEHVHNRRDLYHCALVNRDFHRAVTPFLYRTLDSQIRVIRNHSGSRVIHPAATLLQQPSYAHYVRHVSETATSGDVASTLMPSSHAAFRLCKNLQSFSWTGGGFLSEDDSGLVAYLDAIVAQDFPVRSLVIRASPGLSLAVWNRLKTLTSLTSLGLWCLEADHIALQEWLGGLGKTLTRLELVISPLSDHYMQYLSYLPHLESLCLKAATRCSIPDILTLVPSLTSLEVEYYGFSPIARRAKSLPMASLRSLTISTSAVGSGPQEMWAWIQQLVPRPSLESFTLRAFSAQGTIDMPLAFLESMAEIHGETLRQLMMENVQMSAQVFKHACAMLPQLKRLSCSLPHTTSVTTVRSVIAVAPNLRELRMAHRSMALTLEEAERWMAREGSQLRVIEVLGARFTGGWVYKQLSTSGERCFKVKCDSNKTHSTWI